MLGRYDYRQMTLALYESVLVISTQGHFISL